MTPVHRAKRHTLGIELSLTGVTAKVLTVIFHKDFIFLAFAHHPSSTGVLSLATVPPGRDASVNLAQEGGVTSHRIKYSHPIDGRAHFSQDKRIRTKFFAQAPRLDTHDGHLFSLDVRGLSLFEQYVSGTPEPCVAFVGDRETASETIHVAGYWHPVPAETDWSQLVNPITLQRPGAAPITGVAIAPPAGSPLQNHILLFNTYQRAVNITPEAEFVLVFVGGFDPNLTDHTKEASFLSLLYPGPADPAAELIDFVPNVLTEEDAPTGDVSTRPQATTRS
jgi:hypothetical protein